MSPTDPKNEILKNVDLVPREGVPGRLAVLGDQAFPILCGDSVSDVVIAAAYHGEGRVAIFTHAGYLNKFAEPPENFMTLMGNLQNWLVNGILKDPKKEILTADGLDCLPDDPAVKVIVWKGENCSSDKLVSDIDAFVNKGGALVTGMCPWGWLSLNTNKNLYQVPAFDILHKIGVYYIQGYVSTNSKGFVPETNAGTMKSHLEANIDLISAIHEKVENNAMQAYKTCSDYFDHLPTFVLVHHMEEKVRSLWEECRVKMETKFPCKDEPCKTEEAKKFVNLCNESFLHTIDTTAPGVHVFPGDHDNCLDLVCSDFHMKSTAFKGDCQPTGLYAVAGQKFKVKVMSDIDEDEKNSWYLVVGCHSDNITKCNEYRRWPKLINRRKIKSGEWQFGSPFGGLIYLENPGKVGSELKIEIEGAIQAPLFDITDPDNDKKWELAKNHPGKWADIMGKYTMFTMPTSSVKDHKNLTDVIKFWDDVMTLHQKLRGRKPAEERRQWIVCDEQPSNGYMHAGYPVVTHLDVSEPDHKDFLLSEKLKETGHWGMFHELGHNMQEGEWTFDGTSEVTVNIFTLHAFDQLIGQKPWIHKWMQANCDKAVTYLKDGADFDNVWKKEPGIALFIYGQLQACFGWGAYKTVFKQYHALEKKDKPKNNGEKMDQWIIRFSKVADFNLIPLFQFWGFPINDDIKKEVADLDSFLPDDDLTRAVPERTEEILKSFPDCKRKKYAAGE